PLALPLHLDVDEQPGFATVGAPDLEKFVGEAAADAGVADDLLEFRVEALIAALPVDARVDGREQEGQEGVKEVLQGLLPRAVQVARWLLSGSHAASMLYFPAPKHSPRPS